MTAVNVELADSLTLKSTACLSRLVAGSSYICIIDYFFLSSSPKLSTPLSLAESLSLSSSAELRVSPALSLSELLSLSSSAGLAGVYTLSLSESIYLVSSAGLTLREPYSLYLSDSIGLSSSAGLELSLKLSLQEFIGLVSSAGLTLREVHSVYTSDALSLSSSASLMTVHYLTAKSRVVVIDVSSLFIASRSITARSIIELADSVKFTVQRKPRTAPLLAVVALLVLILLAVVAGRRVIRREA